MNYAIIPPPKQLSDLVKCFWTIESSPNGFKPTEYFLMADGCAEIIVQYKGGFTLYSDRKAHVRIQHATSKKMALESEFGFFGVRLFPHAIQQLLGLPTGIVADQVLDFHSLFKQPGRDLSDRILESADTMDRVRLFSDFLVHAIRNKEADPIKVFANLIDQCEGQVKISYLQQQSGLSMKQFERRFTATTGFTPKLFARIARFQSTKRTYVSDHCNSLTELAHACNYYDQSHFIREFKEFSGVQASHYFSFIDKGDSESHAIKNLIIAKERNDLRRFPSSGITAG